MKITESKLKSLIEEEIAMMIENGEIDEGILDRIKAQAAGLGTKAKGMAKGAVQKGLGSVVGAAGKLGAGDAATKAGADLKKAASDTATATAAGAQTAKIQSILKSTLKNLQNDLTKLGVAGDVRVRKAMETVQQAVLLAVGEATGGAQKAAAE